MTTDTGTNEIAATDPSSAQARPRTGTLAVTLAALLILTALEVVIVGLPVDRAARITALVGLGMTKGLLLLTVFMRIGRESRIQRLGVLVPLVLAPGFAVALMLDTVFRVTQR
jgi:heme/copper-type cytochrome/quinol oxidase subunit 4